MEEKVGAVSGFSVSGSGMVTDELRTVTGRLENANPRNRMPHRSAGMGHYETKDEGQG